MGEILYQVHWTSVLQCLFVLNLFIILAVLGLCCCTRACLQLWSAGATLQLPRAGFSPLWLLSLRAQAPGVEASEVADVSAVVFDFSAFNLRALEHSLNSYGFRDSLPRATQGLPRPEIEPMSPALAGKFFSTELPGKPQQSFCVTIVHKNCFLSDYSLCLVAQSCLTLCDPMDCSLPGSSVRGILQARILQWVAIPSSRASSQPRDRTQFSLIAGGFFTV